MAERLATKKSEFFRQIVMPFFSLRKGAYFMSRKFKTSKKKRTNYIYYGKGSIKTVLIPGEDGVTEAIIETL